MSERGRELEKESPCLLSRKSLGKTLDLEQRMRGGEVVRMCVLERERERTEDEQLMRDLAMVSVQEATEN
jgi:hypothetical protein